MTGWWVAEIGLAALTFAVMRRGRRRRALARRRGVFYGNNRPLDHEGWR